MRTLTIAAVLAAASAAHADELYVLAGEVFPTLHKLNPATGAILESHAVTGHEALFGGLAANSPASLYSIDGYNDANSDRLFQINPATGAGAVIGSGTRFNWNFRCVTFHPVSGVLFGATDNALYTIDTTSGEATLIANITGANLDQLTALAISPTGQAFGTDIGDTDLFSVNLTTGAATRIAPVGGSGNWFSDLAFDSSGTLHGVRFSGGVYTINTATAAITSEFPGTYTGIVYIAGGTPPCYPNCDGSTGNPLLTANDFSCFLNSYVSGESYANCDGTGGLTANDFTCFLSSYVNGCS